MLTDVHYHVCTVLMYNDAMFTHCAARVLKNYYYYYYYYCYYFHFCLTGILVQNYCKWKLLGLQEMYNPSWSFWGDATVPVNYAAVTTTTGSLKTKCPSCCRRNSISEMGRQYSSVILVLARWWPLAITCIIYICGVEASESLHKSAASLPLELGGSVKRETQWMLFHGWWHTDTALSLLWCFHTVGWAIGQKRPLACDRYFS